MFAEGMPVDATAAVVENVFGDEMWKLNDKRYVCVRSHLGREIIEIRDYYTEKGSSDLMPSKNGIAMTIAEWALLKLMIKRIDAKLP
jgi:hypothetical protein